MNEDCIFNRCNKRCLALTTAHCEDCHFYKSKQDYVFVIEKSPYYNNKPIKAVRKRRKE